MSVAKPVQMECANAEVLTPAVAKQPERTVIQQQMNVNAQPRSLRAIKVRHVIHLITSANVELDRHAQDYQPDLTASRQITCASVHHRWAHVHPQKHVIH